MEEELRDKFAIAAMVAIFQNNRDINNNDIKLPNQIANIAYQVADEMLKARKNK